ncbi:hypothetical protein ERUR111494_02500 [Erysipelothrix urinaevulpis]|uniref:hypothetical protein n=1 Tax=Erysipelothrix urinaevulpis TaxID=2683717 RepID=UPI00135B4567|nr:hypothetical protein [Erysipelothrix urinaevulpis]
MMNERDHINYAKSELRNYMYLLNVCHGFENKIIELETLLEGMKSTAAVYEPGSSSLTPAERNNDLRDKLQRNQYDLAAVRYRTDRTKKFLDDLSKDDRIIVTDVYIKNINIEKVATRFYCSEKTMKRRIDLIMKKY